MINKIDLRKAISSIAISNAKRNTIYKAFSDLDSITKEEFDSVKSDISKVVESMLTKDTVGKANGVASLDSNGNVPIEQLGNIDTKLFLIVRELPTTDIQSNKIYLVPNQDGQGNNVYIEYLYVESVWEKVGEFKPEVSLSEYVKSNDIYQCIKKEYDLSKRGENAIAIDDSAIASGKFAIAIGNNAQANGTAAIALGSGARATEDNSISICGEATGMYSITLGSGAQTTGDMSTALGSYAQATTNAIAVGSDAQATGNAATALGSGARATDSQSTALGSNSQADFPQSTALGYSAQATGDSSTAIGCYAQATGNDAIAVGSDAQATGEMSIALDGGATGYYSIAICSEARATGDYSIALGGETQATGNFSIALGAGASTSTVSKYALGGVDENKQVIFNLEEITYSQYGNKKYLIGLGGYDGTNITINNEAGEEILNPNIKSVQEIINSKADASAIPTKLSQLTNDANFITSYTETDPVWTREKANYYTKTEINNKGYLTQHQPLDNYVTKSTADANYLSLANGGDIKNEVTISKTNATNDDYTLHLANEALYIGQDNGLKSVVAITPHNFAYRDFVFYVDENQFSFATCFGVKRNDEDNGGENTIQLGKVSITESSLSRLNLALDNITAASTAEEVVTKFNALLADLKNKGLMEADTAE